MNQIMETTRQARREDLPEVMRIEECWPEHERASLAQFEARITRYPAGFLVVGEEGALDGVMTACPIEYDPCNTELLKTWDAVTGGGFLREPARRPEHNALYIVSGVVRPERRGRGAFQRLVLGEVDVAQREGFRYVVAGATIPGYQRHCEKHGETSAADYAFLARRGRLVDPFLEAYRPLEFRVPDRRHVVSDYYPDPASKGYAALVVREVE
jgi:hypothetical protein